MATAPVSIGFCSSLFLIFVILPSISWYSDSVSADRSIPKKKDDQEDGEKKRTTFTPKMSSYLMFLAAFLLPGMIMFQSFTSNQNISFIGLLLQFSFGFSTDFSQLGLAYTLQDIIFWDLFGVSIVCCAASLVFAWTIMRYVHGKGTKRIAILVGFLSEIPPILYTINGLAYGLAYVSVWLILPLPIVLIIGLLVLRFTTAIEQIRKSTELDQSVIKVPLKFRMKSHLFGQHKRSDETPLESRDAGDEEAQ